MQLRKLPFLLAIAGNAVRAQSPVTLTTSAGATPTALPPCAQPCIDSALAQSNCGSLNNLTCICQDRSFNDPVGSCELSTCSTSELLQIGRGAEAFCAPVGGLLPAGRADLASASALAALNASATANASSPTSTVPFTGEAGTWGGNLGVAVLISLAGVLLAAL